MIVRHFWKSVSKKHDKTIEQGVQIIISKKNVHMHPSTHIYSHFYRAKMTNCKKKKGEKKTNQAANKLRKKIGTMFNKQWTQSIKNLCFLLGDLKFKS